MNRREYIAAWLELTGAAAWQRGREFLERTARALGYAVIGSVILGASGFCCRALSGEESSVHKFGLLLMAAGWLVAALYLLIVRLRLAILVWAVTETSESVTKLGEPSVGPEKPGSGFWPWLASVIRLPTTIIERLFRAVPTVSPEEAEKFISRWILRPFAWYVWLGLVLTTFPFHKSPPATLLVLLAGAALVFTLMYFKVESPWERRILLTTPPLIILWAVLGMAAPHVKTTVEKAVYLPGAEAAAVFQNDVAAREKELDVQVLKKARISELGGRKVALTKELLSGVSEERKKEIVSELAAIGSEIEDLKSQPAKQSFWSAVAAPFAGWGSKRAPPPLDVTTPVYEPDLSLLAKPAKRGLSHRQKVARQVLEELDKAFPELREQ